MIIHAITDRIITAMRRIMRIPPDNAATVAPGTDVSFPRDGSVSSLDIVRTGPSSFNLTEVGTYNYTSCWRNASRFCTSGYCPVTVIGIYRWI